MENILIFGAGFLGNRISGALECPVYAPKINTIEDAQKAIDFYKPKVIINCIGSYGKNVDDCEKDKTKSMIAFTLAPLLLAESAIRNGIKLVHISSGCLYKYDYAQNVPIPEDQPPDFFSLYYSRLKIYAEAALYSLGDAANILQLRIRMPLDYIPHPRNLLTKLTSYNSVLDIPNSVTYIPDMIQALKHLLSVGAEGVFNVVNYGGLRYRELLEEYRKYNRNFSYSIMELSELKSVRTNLILSTDKLEASGYTIRDIHECLPECVEQYVKLEKKSIYGLDTRQGK